MSRSIFITGTGTDVGKTFISGLILKKLHEAGLSAAYFKAAMSGNERGADGALIPGDAVHVRNVSGIQQPVDEMCPYIYERAVSPHLAARTEGAPIDIERVSKALEHTRAHYDFVTIEGSGGIICPLRIGDGHNLWLEDFIKVSGAPCLLVADAGLGTINSAALTAFYMRERGIPLRGIIFNRFREGDSMHEDNLRMCGQVTGLSVLARVSEGGDDIGMTAAELSALYA